MRRLVVAASVGIALSFAASGCGGDATEIPPRAVDPSLAPEAVVDGALKFYENTDDSTRRAFADAGDSSLVADGRLWEIRRADRLVGILQVSTLVNDVDLSEADNREAIVGDILVGGSTRLDINGVEVATIRVADQAVYVWFGDDLVGILTVDGFEEIDPTDVLEDVIAHQQSVTAWVPLQPGEDDVPLDLPA